MSEAEKRRVGLSIVTTPGASNAMPQAFSTFATLSPSGDGLGMSIRLPEIHSSVGVLTDNFGSRTAGHDESVVFDATGS